MGIRREFSNCICVFLVSLLFLYFVFIFPPFPPFSFGVRSRKTTAIYRRHGNFTPIQKGPLWGGGVKKGQFVIFCVSLVLQYLGVPTYPDAGKNSTKSVIVTPLFVCPKC